MGKLDIEQHSLNAEKSLVLAAALFPDEEWINTEKNIYVSKSRMIEKTHEQQKWEREMSQVRILANRGSVVYFWETVPLFAILSKPGNCISGLMRI